MNVTKFDSLGREIPDPTPVEVPLRVLQAFESLQDQIRRTIRMEMSRAAGEAGQETFEEADDFDVDDEEPELVSAYEIPEAPVDWPLSGPVAKEPGNAPRKPQEARRGDFEGEEGEDEDEEPEAVVEAPKASKGKPSVKKS